LTFASVTLKRFATVTIATMSKYRARHCPNCHYFIGFAAAKHVARDGVASLTNFCLNCNYKLPVHSIVHGIRKPTQLSRRKTLRLVSGAQDLPVPNVVDSNRNSAMDIRISPTDYARHLRAIGQDLENLHLASFNLEYVGDAYLVWVRSDEHAESTNRLSRISKNRLQKLWRNKTPARTLGHEEAFPVSGSQTGRRLRYSVQELDRIEREQRARRRQQSGTADGHCLSQLLRTVGDLVGQRGERLLGIAWQELSVSVVVETPYGRKEIDVFRPDNLYDLWVRMYLKRDNHAFFDTPH
jgi:hypothetical protein